VFFNSPQLQTHHHRGFEAAARCLPFMGSSKTRGYHGVSLSDRAFMGVPRGAGLHGGTLPGSPIPQTFSNPLGRFGASAGAAFCGVRNALAPAREACNTLATASTYPPEWGPPAGPQTLPVFFAWGHRVRPVCTCRAGHARAGIATPKYCPLWSCCYAFLPRATAAADRLQLCLHGGQAVTVDHCDDHCRLQPCRSRQLLPLCLNCVRQARDRRSE